MRSALLPFTWNLSVRLNQSDFARICGVTKQAITLAIASGRVMRTEDGIDPEHPINQKFLRNIDRERQMRGKKNDNQRKKGRSGEGRGGEDWKIGAEDNSPAAIGINVKSNYEIEKIKAQTEQIKLAIAERMEILIVREEVDKLMGDLYAVIINYFFPFGDRLAPLIAGKCKMTNPDVILQIKTIIDDEMIKALTEIKRKLGAE